MDVGSECGRIAYVHQLENLDACDCRGGVCGGETSLHPVEKLVG